MIKCPSSRLQVLKLLWTGYFKVFFLTPQLLLTSRSSYKGG